MQGICCNCCVWYAATVSFLRDHFWVAWSMWFSEIARQNNTVSQSVGEECVHRSGCWTKWHECEMWNKARNISVFLGECTLQNAHSHQLPVIGSSCACVDGEWDAHQTDRQTFRVRQLFGMNAETIVVLMAFCHNIETKPVAISTLSASMTSQSIDRVSSIANAHNHPMWMHRVFQLEWKWHIWQMRRENYSRI